MNLRYLDVLLQKLIDNFVEDEISALMQQNKK